MWVPADYSQLTYTNNINDSQRDRHTDTHRDSDRDKDRDVHGVSDDERKLPLVLYLHGASSRHTSSCTSLLSTSLPRLLLLTPQQEEEERGRERGSGDEERKCVSAMVRGVVVSPLCPPCEDWKTPHMCSLLHSLITTSLHLFSLHPGKVVVTGVSMGGLGAWMLTARFVNCVAAVVPVCGGSGGGRGREKCSGGGRGRERGGAAVVYARLLKNTPWYLTLHNYNTTLHYSIYFILFFMFNDFFYSVVFHFKHLYTQCEMCHSLCFFVLMCCIVNCVHVYCI